MCYGGFVETVIAAVIYFASIFTIILSPVISVIIPPAIRIMKKTGHY